MGIHDVGVTRSESEALREAAARTRLTEARLQSTFVSGSNHTTGSYLVFEPTHTTPLPTPTTDFNNDGYADYLLFNPSTRQTVMWYLNNHVLIGHAYGPTLWSGWSLVGVADFNGDGKSDYLLYNPTTRQTAIWYLNNDVLIGHTYGPTVCASWSVVAP
jgi:hypothetical protein